MPFIFHIYRTNRFKETETTAILRSQLTKNKDKVYPIDEFKKRISKKSFGDYIDAKNSPIQPERFKGFHTGVDVEYEDIKEEVPVFAVCAGEMVLTRWVSGYGGTVVLKCQSDYVLYGHLKEESISKKNRVIEGEKIAVLGEGKTKETDFERKHLHFGIHRNSIDLRGYVQNKNELNEWLDPEGW